jgi:hypothetical protein
VILGHSCHAKAIKVNVNKFFNFARRSLNHFFELNYIWPPIIKRACNERIERDAGIADGFFHF